ncbi:hypothetical protein [Kitasatospora sp. NPDC093679]|uniref:hypothetical protein n=1 Tax=Kitasatospora sp. NPDC093679 TaxID=3154983 RepID=UPI00341FD573
MPKTSRRAENRPDAEDEGDERTAEPRSKKVNEIWWRVGSLVAPIVAKLVFKAFDRWFWDE